MAAPDLDLDVRPVFAALQPDGSILLELSVNDGERLVKATMPPSPYSLVLAREVVVPLDLDELPTVAPELAGEIDWECGLVRDRLAAGGR